MELSIGRLKGVVVPMPKEPRLFHTNLLLVRTCGEKAEFGTISAGSEHFSSWKDTGLESNRSEVHDGADHHH